MVYTTGGVRGMSANKRIKMQVREGSEKNSRTNKEITTADVGSQQMHPTSSNMNNRHNQSYD